MRNTGPVFKYHISGISGEFTDASPLWQTPLTGDIHAFSPTDTEVAFTNTTNGETAPLMIHEYLESAEKFLKSNRFQGVMSALSTGPDKDLFHPTIETSPSKEIFPSQTEPEQIAQIDIFLEKHGAFYHPARVQLSMDDHSRKILALNGAVSPRGLALIQREYSLLSQLNHEKSELLPRVFGMDSIACRGMKISFFLAEWFEGYREFHLTDDNASSPPMLHLWKGDGSVTAYSPPDYFEIYEKASEILTIFYNLKTFEQIFPWHHAAGDFIAKPTAEGFDVRLISARGYASMLASGEDNQDVNQEDINNALLIFFLNLSLRMRIDRQNGTGDYCLVHPDVIDFIVKGFFRALKNKKHPHSPKESLSKAFASYLLQFEHEGLQLILDMITDAGNPKNPEIAFIKANLDSHSKMLSQKIHKAGKKCFFIDKTS